LELSMHYQLNWMWSQKTMDHIQFDWNICQSKSCTAVGILKI